MNPNFKYARLLNRLHEMQQLGYYAIAHNDLREAENAIVDLETELKLCKEQNNMPLKGICQ